MFLLYLIIILLIIFGLKPYRQNYYDGYLSKEQTNSIKGFFIVVVFCRHIAPYLADSGYDFSIFGDNIFRWIDGRIKQLLVVMFLFYSGYGVMESIKKKGKTYIDSIPHRRLLTTLLNFDVAVVIFLVVDICLDIHYETKDIVLAFSGWKSIGNSNWYIFVILCCYFSTFLAYKIFARINNNRSLIGGGNLLIIICIYVVLVLKKQGYWYDTIFSYPLGIYFSLYKNEIENVFKRIYAKCLPVIFTLFLLLMFLPYDLKGIVANTRACTLAMLIVLLSMKFQINSKVLLWLGKHLFPLYIYQRIGMIILSEYDGGAFIHDNPYIYILSCALITLTFGWTYKYIQIKINK